MNKIINLMFIFLRWILSIIIISVLMGLFFGSMFYLAKSNPNLLLLLIVLGYTLYYIYDIFKKEEKRLIEKKIFLNSIYGCHKK